MSSKSYGVYLQGAVFTFDDFDPYKLIIHYYKHINKTMPENIKNNLSGGIIEPDTVAYIKEILEIPEMVEVNNYSVCVKYLEDYIEDLFFAEECPLSSEFVTASHITDLEGLFVYDNSVEANACVSECFILSVPLCLAWNIADCVGPRTRSDVIKALQQATNALLKDGIDWDKRLGELNGSSFN